MPYAVLERKIKSLPESCFEEISQFLDFIKYKVQFSKEIPKKKSFDDFDALVIPTECGKNADEYIRELRAKREQYCTC